jgi:D-3-phosphoglycerate dehydrogenase
MAGPRLQAGATVQAKDYPMPKVLISDKMDPKAAQIFRERGVEVDEITGKTPDELKAMIGQYDGLAIRSSTKVTKDILEAATNLKVVGRAGIGVDNVDIPAASAKGVVVMNTPFGNSITTAEHAIALMFALARDLPEADRSTQAGKWEKNRFMGVEVTGKTLGLIGAGNIGSIVADRALGLKMKVVAYDPFLTEERAIELGVQKVTLDELLARADFITLHTPLTDQTRNILSAENLAKTKKGVRIINCARGGLIDEAALKQGLDSGHIGGAALDVFVTEPANESPLFGTPNFISTPHLGASTTEAQVNVAIQVAEQMADYLVSGGVTNALNMPSLTAEEAPKLKPYMGLAEKLGSLVGQLAHGAIDRISIHSEGAAAELNPKPLTSAVLKGFLGTQTDTVNMVNAPLLARERGMEVREIRTEREGDYHTLLRVSVRTADGERSVAGTLFGDQAARLVELFGIKVEADLTGAMLYVVNEDAPGFIGRLGTTLGEAGVNIGTFHLGRRQAGGEAVLLLSVDQPVTAELLATVKALPGVKTAMGLRF